MAPLSSHESEGKDLGKAVCETKQQEERNEKHVWERHEHKSVLVV